MYEDGAVADGGKINDTNNGGSGGSNPSYFWKPPLKIYREFRTMVRKSKS